MLIVSPLIAPVFGGGGLSFMACFALFCHCDTDGQSIDAVGGTDGGGLLEACRDNRSFLAECRPSSSVDGEVTQTECPSECFFAAGFSHTSVGVLVKYKYCVLY